MGLRNAKKTFHRRRASGDEIEYRAREATIRNAILDFLSLRLCSFFQPQRIEFKLLFADVVDAELVYSDFSGYFSHRSSEIASDSISDNLEMDERVGSVRSFNPWAVLGLPKSLKRLMALDTTDFPTLSKREISI